MTKDITNGVGRFYQHYPQPVVVVTSRSKDRENAMTVVWHCAVSYSPPLYAVAVSPRRFTYRLIMESREFGVNFMPVEQTEVMARLGVMSGEKLDKFEAFNIARSQPSKINAPLLSEAYASYECRLVDQRSYGDHTLFVGEVVAVHTDPQAFTPEEVLDLKKVQPALYLGGDIYFSADSGSQRQLDRDYYKQPATAVKSRRRR